MSKELTYILGAGASFRSIPIVKSFANRFEEFCSFLDGYSVDPRLEAEKRNVLALAFHKAKKISNAFKEHQSFDTYFKKLFHTGENEKIKEAKKVLNLYFIWEHLSRPTNKPGVINEYVFWKQTLIDNRYDALIAGLLKPVYGKTEPYCPINFITWNYDLNLLVSLKNYFAPSDSIGDFLKKIDKGNNQWQIGDKISVSNMNGYFYSSQFSLYSDLVFESDKKEIYDVIYEKLKINFFDQGSYDGDAELIKFAWESSEESKIESLPIVKSAMNKIANSGNVIVIGYTFPLYNRLVDFQYFNSSNLSNRYLYIQDPNASEITKLLVSDFNLDITTSSRTPVIEKTNCDSFLIPSNIFKNI